MCRDTFLSDILNALFFDQSTQSVEGTSRFEGTDLLLVLTLEEKPDFWVGFEFGSIALDAVGMRSRLGSYIQAGCWTPL